MLLYTNEVFERTEQRGVLAQLGEHLPYKQRVTGSSPVGPTYFSESITKAEYGGIAQLARAHGSYPWCREFKSPFRYYTAWTVCPGFFFVRISFLHKNIFSVVSGSRLHIDFT